MTTRGEHEPGDPVVIFNNESYDGYELEVVRGDKPFQSDHYYGLLSLTDTRLNKVLIDKAEVGISLLTTVFGATEQEMLDWYAIAEDAILKYEVANPGRREPLTVALVFEGKLDIRSGEDAGAYHEDS